MIKNKSSNKHLYIVMLCIAIILFIDNVDVNALNIALPSIAQSMGVEFKILEWLVNAYFVFAAAFFVFSGYISDRFGIRNTLCLGILLILISSCFAGFANNAAELIVWRSIQGIGYAFTFCDYSPPYQAMLLISLANAR